VKREAQLELAVATARKGMEMVKHEAKLRENRLEEQARRLRFLLDRHEEAATAAAGRHAESKAKATRQSKAVKRRQQIGKEGSG
jgi:hypothetical protein